MFNEHGIFTARLTDRRFTSEPWSPKYDKARAAFETYEDLFAKYEALAKDFVVDPARIPVLVTRPDGRREFTIPALCGSKDVTAEEQAYFVTKWNELEEVIEDLCRCDYVAKYRFAGPEHHPKQYKDALYQNLHINARCGERWETK